MIIVHEAHARAASGTGPLLRHGAALSLLSTKPSIAGGWWRELQGPYLPLTVFGSFPGGKLAAQKGPSWLGDRFSSRELKLVT